MQLHMSPMNSLPLILSIVGDVQFTGSAPSEHVCETLFVSMAHSIFFQDVVLLRSATKIKGPWSRARTHEPHLAHGPKPHRAHGFHRPMGPCAPFFLEAIALSETILHASHDMCSIKDN